MGEEREQFAIAKVLPGKLNALVKTLMRQMEIKDPNEAVRRVSSGEWIVMLPPYRWLEEDGVIYFTLPPTDGTTGLQWIDRLGKKEIVTTSAVEEKLLSPDFIPTSGIITKVVILKGMLFETKDRTEKEVYGEANRRNLTELDLETMCLISEMFTSKEIKSMGLWSIIAANGSLITFCIGNYVELSDNHRDSDNKFPRQYGFAFAVSRMQT